MSRSSYQRRSGVAREPVLQDLVGEGRVVVGLLAHVPDHEVALVATLEEGRHGADVVAARGARYLGLDRHGHADHVLGDIANIQHVGRGGGGGRRIGLAGLLQIRGKTLVQA